MKPYTSYIHEYYDAITTGRVTVGEWIRLIYKILITGLENGRWFFDAKKANKAIRFIENFCHHSEGRSDLLKLELWQKAIVSAIFGIIDKNGFRQFREVFIIVARKNGKTLFAAAIIAYMAYLDGEYGAKIYCLAPKLEQADLVYDAFYQIVQSDDELGDPNFTKKRRSDIYIEELNTSFAASRTCFKDFSDCFNDENPTIDSLRDVAQKWVQTSGFDIPQISFTVSFKHLWKSPEYRKYAALERVSLCDTVCVYYEKLGISAKAKVIKTVYNTLKEDYESLDLGDAKANFADSITSADSAIENVKNDIKRQNTAVNVKLAQAIAEATAAITGQNGGYVVLNPPKNPQEILIMDSPNIETAVNVWRWNSAGLGHSSTGYNGKFALAMTADGSIVADFITTGNLNGALISAESIKANAISAEYKKEVTDEIGSSKESVTQEFKAADEELKSTIEKELEGLSAKSEIKQLNDKISLIVTAKDGENKVDSAAIVAAINDETSTVLINAGKIDLTAYAKTSEIEDAADEAASEAINRITLSTTDGEKSSTIKILYDGVEIGSAEIKLTGAVTFADLSAAGKTAINGGNITTGKISAERIDVANLLIKKLYSQGTGTGHYLKIASGFGDFGIFQNTAADDATPTSADCVLGMYNDFGNAINFYTYGNNFFGYNLNSHKVFPKEAWDFSSAEVTGLAVRFS